MIDFRVNTFLDLCETRSYTKTAQNLNITQPAASQHIKYLEKMYNINLFEYKNKVLLLTHEGEVYLKYAKQIKAQSIEIKEFLGNIEQGKPKIKIGATRTIGDYCMPSIIEKYFKEYNIQVNLIVDNTENILANIDKGEVECAFIEGIFDKDSYETKLYKREEIVCIIAPSELKKIRENSGVDLLGKDIKEENAQVMIEELFKQNLLVREGGSGSRKIFENELDNKGYKVDRFNSIIEIGSINVIKELVKKGLGISFIYKTAVKKEVINKEVEIVEISDLKMFHEFNFIHIKGSARKDQYEKLLNLIMQ